jgi:protein O-mannosyl-transferase
MPPTSAKPASRFSPWLVAAVIAMVVIAAHWPSLDGEFLFDDVGEIAENRSIRSLWPPWRPMFEGGSLPHRPIPSYTFAVNYALHGLDPRGYHAVNIAIHLVNGWLVWWVLRWIGRRTGSGCDAVPGSGRGGSVAGDGIALAAAALWLVHPLTTQAVDYVYQRMELLGATAILATVAAFLRSVDARQPVAWQAAAVVACGLGMLCKETVVAAPLIVLLIDWLVVRHDADRPWMSLGTALRVDGRFLAALFATFGVAAWVVLVQKDRFGELAAPVTDRWTYAVNQPLIVLDYLRRAAWPAGLCLDHYRRPAESQFMLAAGLAALAAAAAVAVASLSRSPLVTLCIAAFVALLGPTSSFLPVNDLMVEHRMYLPLAVLVAGSVGGAWQAASRWGGRFGQRLAMPLGVALFLALAATTFLRSGVFASRYGMWQDVTTKASANPRAWAGLADELVKRGNLDASLAALDKSIALAPDAQTAHVLRSNVLLALERPTEALAAAERAIEVDPARGRGFTRRAAALVDLGRFDEAAAACQQAFERDAADVVAWRLLSEALVRTGRDSEAVEVCRRLFTVDPPEPEADGSVHVRHGIRYATLAAALAGLNPDADTRRQIGDILARATLIDPDAPRTTAMIALARERLTAAAGAAAGAGVSRSPAPAD